MNTYICDWKVAGVGLDMVVYVCPDAPAPAVNSYSLSLRTGGGGSFAERFREFTISRMRDKPR